MNKVELNNYNQETYDNIVKLWEDGQNRVAVVQATGTGKSYLIAKTSEEFSNKKILILAPRTHILNELENLIGHNENCTYLTYSKLNFINEDEMKDLKCDLIILDEFHRCGSSSWFKNVNQLLNIYNNAKVLGTTATNVRYLDNHRDMATELFNNCLACKTDLSDAINKKILPMPIYVTSLYSVDEEVENLKRKINVDDEIQYKNITDKLDGLKEWNSTTGVPNILKKYIDSNNNKFIVFCKNTSHLEESEKIVYKWFKHANIKDNIKTYRLTHENGTKKNDEELFNFKNGDSDSMHLLFSIDILNEGFHLDSVGVILLRETSSPTLFFQQIGRALTASNSNTPIIFDFVNNFNSLKSHAFRNALVESRNKILLDKPNLEKIDFTIYDESKSFRDVLGTISDLILDEWDVKYEQLYQYYMKHGNTSISKNVKELSTLYRWASKQRVLNNKGMLSKDKIDKLNTINFTWNVNEDKWMQNYFNLVKYYNEFGNTKVSQSYNKTLNIWCGSQRYKKGKLSTKQIELLNELNFKWNVLDAEFEEKVSELIEYKKKYGDLLVPRRYEENPQLANWVVRNRCLKKKRQLSQDKINILNQLGFVWDIEDYTWELRFSQLSKYYNETQDYFNKGIIDKSLKDWTTRQRQYYRLGKISDDRIKKLESINFRFILD